jgi:hypothetical protein
MGFYQIKKFLPTKKTIKRLRVTYRVGEKFANSAPDTGKISRTYEELKKHIKEQVIQSKMIK